ncbi:hypothetical protein BKA64DRAFT_687506, partial [Cadophora sp. MPI-SDFR-AT-0126]
MLWLPGVQTSCLPDRCYYVRRQLHEDEEVLPSIRTTAHTMTGVETGPPYLVTEDKRPARKGGEKEALQYLALVTASLLHEQLLLWSMGKEAHAKNEISLDDAGLQIFGMTNWGENVKLFRMAIRPSSQEELNRLGNTKRYARYDLTRLGAFNLKNEEKCERLKTCMNYIHWWGLTVHKNAVAVKAEDALRGPAKTIEGYLERLPKIAFFYTSPTTLGFHTLSDGGRPPLSALGSTTYSPSPLHTSISTLKAGETEIPDATPEIKPLEKPKPRTRNSAKSGPAPKTIPSSHKPNPTPTKPSPKPNPTSNPKQVAAKPKPTANPKRAAAKPLVKARSSTREPKAGEPLVEMDMNKTQLPIKVSSRQGISSSLTKVRLLRPKH